MSYGVNTPVSDLGLFKTLLMAKSDFSTTECTTEVTDPFICHKIGREALVTFFQELHLNVKVVKGLELIKGTFSNLGKV